MDSQNVEAVVRILSSSHQKSDSEKLAALLLVAKLLKSNELSKDEELNIFQSINIPFLIKLLKTRSQPSECSSTCYKSIALSIFRSFSSLPFEDDTVTAEVLPFLIDIIRENSKQDAQHIESTNIRNERGNEGLINKSIRNSGGNIVNDINDEDRMLDDAHIIIFLMMQPESNGREMLLKSELPSLLSAIISNTAHGFGHALCTFLIMISLDDFYLFINTEKEFLKLIENLANRLSNRNDDAFIKVLDVLVKIFENSFSIKVLSLYESESFWTIFLRSIYNIITSKIDILFCQRALLLSSYIINLFGFSWPLLKNHESLVRILLHLASIEIRMMLDEEMQETQQQNSLPLLEGLAILFIEAIKYVQEYKSLNVILSSQKLSIGVIQEMIFDCIFSIVHFIKNCHFFDVFVSNDLLSPCMCILSAYISFREFAFDEDIVDLVPILIDACNTNLNVPNGISCIEDASTVTQDNQIDPANVNQNLDKSLMLHIFLPGFEHLSHLVEVRQVFVKKKFIPVLIKHMKMCGGASSNSQDDVMKIIDILYIFVVAEELIESLDVFKYLIENLSDYGENCIALILAFAILLQYPVCLSQDLNLQELVTSGITILKNKNARNELRDDLIANMTKCFSRYPQLANLVSEADHKSLFLI